ncbi:MAG: peroxiredoxin [Xanthomonadales bacterium]|nr:peroxiredoxin [Xanthomonadales bacterium]
MLKIDHPAPEFELEDESGKTFSLREQRGEMVLLVFYPGDDTPVCTRQLCDYRDGIEAFRDLGVRVIGISRDDADSHRAFKAKHQLPFTLLSDPHLEVAEKYESKGMLGMKRSVFLIDEKGMIRYLHIETLPVFRRAKEEILEAIERVQGTQAE